MTSEQHFLDEIIANPEDDFLRMALADWLEEQGDPRSELMRIQEQLRKIEVPEREQLESRMRELLYEQNVSPVVPTATNSIGMKFGLIPSGEFVMGSPEDEAERRDSENQVEVEISQSFLLGIYPVSQSEYEEVMGTNPSHFSYSGDGKDEVTDLDISRFPVETVSWEDAIAFCEKLSSFADEQQWGRTYRLPTEAEWEYACRGGTTTPFYYGGSMSSHQANFDGVYPYGGAEKGPFLERPCEVGLYSPNSFGVYDVHGNVSEWCEDWYEEQLPGGKDPQEPSEGHYRVLRGGGWRLNSRFVRSAFRSPYGPGDRINFVGFRCVQVQAS